MAGKKTKLKSKPKLTDPERHARFVETAKKVEASEIPSDFEKTFEAIVPVKPKAISKDSS